MADHVSPLPEVDPRPRQLLLRYATLAGAQVFDVGDHLLEVDLPTSEQRWFGGRAELSVALAPDALEERPDAEILVNGSSLLQQLIDAIRERGALDQRGDIAPDSPETGQLPDLDVALDGRLEGPPRREDARVPVGRLLARLSIHAGPSVVERLVESSIVDLSSGLPLPEDIATRIPDTPAADPEFPMSVPLGRPVPRLATSALLTALFSDLERKCGPELAGIAKESAAALAAELSRLGEYYDKMDSELDPSDTAKAAKERRAAIAADREKRLAEANSRFGVQVTLHPVQLVEWHLPVQRAAWTLVGPTGARGEFAASRTLVGQTAWQLTCPTCGGPPATLRTCQSGHVGCDRCTERCGVCSAGACAAHGLSTCAVEGHPVCASHAATCASCDQTFCELHAGSCDIGAHRACTTCSTRCGRCDIAICSAHGVRTSVDAPRGARWLCEACTVFCEGGANEPVGLDESERCASCERHICAHHISRCAVDAKAHCSRHLRRSDASGRLMCEEHRAPCAEEPESSYATDELSGCASCGKAVCERHRGVCATDGRHHCTSHLMPLRDRPGEMGCEAHREVCAIDHLAFSLGATKLCPVCGKVVCESHLHPCANCGRRTCTRHTDSGYCTTCRKLETTAEPSDEVLAAIAEAAREETETAKEWRVAVDGGHTVVEVPLGWRRRVVLTLRHGEQRAETVVQHGLIGRRRVR
ncbi:MAG: hypothetical protein KJZ74_11225 [Gemmatimonadales bacterium]|nr:hypothetical protein [Gemmatimonadales bacterium]